ncbi:hypothetical protein Dimus_036562 [Dionaea muscipula]
MGINSESKKEKTLTQLTPPASLLLITTKRVVSASITEPPATTVGLLPTLTTTTVYVATAAHHHHRRRCWITSIAGLLSLPGCRVAGLLFASRWWFIGSVIAAMVSDVVMVGDDIDGAGAKVARVVVGGSRMIDLGFF